MNRSKLSTLCIAVLACAALGTGLASASNGDRLATSAGAVPIDVSSAHKNPFASGSSLTPVRSDSAPLGGINAYGWNSQAGPYYTVFDLAVPEVLPNTAASPTTEFVGGVEYIGGSVFLVDNLSEFWELDPATGAILSSGTLTPPTGAETWSGLALDPTTGTVYGSATDVATSSLYTVDFAAGTSTLIAAVTNSPALIAVAVDGAGDLWGYDIVGDYFLSIDKTTGAGTVVGPLGFDANYGQGMAWESTTDTIYLAAFNSTAAQAELRTVDRTTGATTLVGVLGATTPGGLNQLGGVAFEPATAVPPRCPAGAIEVPVLSQDFTDLAGWALANATTGCNLPGLPDWTNTNPGARGNLTGGTGAFAIADSDACGSGSLMNAQLQSPLMDLTGLTDPVVTYYTDYNDIAAGGDVAILDFSTDGGATWTNLTSWDEDHRGPLQITQPFAADNEASTALRWTYTDAGWDWWWEVDDVAVTACDSSNDRIFANGFESP